MLFRRTPFGLLVACIALLAAAPAHALDRAAVGAKLARETAKLGAASGAHVVDLDAGTVLFSRRPDLALVPASNEKLFVTATALLTLGADARRETVVADDAVALSDPKAIATQNLYVIGAGDPSLANADLASLADQLVRQSGLTRVAGGVVGDESLLDARRGSVDSSFKPDFNLGGQLGALVVGHGTTDRVGPAHLVAARLQAMLKARGVRFGRRARTGRAPADAEELATDRSPPISDLVRATNRPSDNFYAELLLKVLGAEEGAAGTTAAGAIVARRRLAQLGLRPTISDGSGLSRGNRTNARQVVTLLRAMRRGVASAAWLDSLSVVGRNGTLRRRMRGTAAAGRCSGKTGTLRGVSALSGYCTTTTGRHVVFSFLENGVGPGAKSVEDRIVAALARYEG